MKQVAVADTILLTKTDIATDASAVEALTARLWTGFTADIELCTQGQTTPETLFAGGMYDPGAKGADVAAWLAQEARVQHEHEHAHDVDRHDDDIVAYAIKRDKPIGRGALSSFLQMLADQRGDNLLRLKGLVALTDDPSRPAVVHGVQHVIHPITRLDAWPDDLNGTAIVLIVRGIEKGLGRGAVR